MNRAFSMAELPPSPLWGPEFDDFFTTDPNPPGKPPHPVSDLALAAIAMNAQAVAAPIPIRAPTVLPLSDNPTEINVHGKSSPPSELTGPDTKKRIITSPIETPKAVGAPATPVAEAARRGADPDILALFTRLNLNFDGGPPTI